MKPRVLDGKAAYEVDFYAWTQTTAESICRGEFGEVDRKHVAEEIADMGKRDRREVRLRLTVLLTHVLKWQAQPELREKSTWRATIIEQRRQLALLFEDSPSLYQVAVDGLQATYDDAIRDAAAETKLQAETFPSMCSYTLDQLLDLEFFR